jgi:hypothetical protein
MQTARILGAGLQGWRCRHEVAVVEALVVYSTPTIFSLPVHISVLAGDDTDLGDVVDITRAG